MRDKRYCASFRFALRAFLSETPKSKLFWSAVGALIGTGINSVIGVFTSTFNYRSSSVWISKGLAALLSTLFGLVLLQNRKRIAKHKDETHREKHVSRKKTGTQERKTMEIFPSKLSLTRESHQHALKPR